MEYRADDESISVEDLAIRLERISLALEDTLLTLDDRLVMIGTLASCVESDDSSELLERRLAEELGFDRADRARRRIAFLSRDVFDDLLPRRGMELVEPE